MKELEITKEDTELLKEMKNNCLRADVYEDEKRLLKANAITKFLVEHEEKQELIDYLKEKMNNIELELVMKSQNDYELGKLQGYYKSCKEILSKIEKR